MIGEDDMVMFTLSIAPIFVAEIVIPAAVYSFCRPVLSLLRVCPINFALHQNQDGIEVDFINSI